MVETPFPEIKKKEVRCCGLRLRYWQCGSGRAVVFFHGMGISSLSYLPALRALSRHFAVYALDIPGFGGSDHPEEGWNYSDFARCAKAWLDRLGLKKVSVIGHSFGGGLAFHLAEIDRRIDKLVLIDAGGLGVPAGIYETLRSLAKTATEFCSKGGLEHIPRLAKDSAQNAGSLCFGLWRTARLCLEDDGSGLMSRITAQTLILWGMKDRWIPPEHGERFKKGIRKARLTLIDGGHAWCIIKPERLVEEVCAFLE